MTGIGDQRPEGQGPGQAPGRLRSRLLRVFREAFDLAPEVDAAALKYREIPAWNSVGHMQLVTAIEAEFDLMLDTEEIIAMSSFDEAERTVGRHLAPP